VFPYEDHMVCGDNISDFCDDARVEQKVNEFYMVKGIVVLHSLNISYDHYLNSSNMNVLFL
jgi:hypothetical protein